MKKIIIIGAGEGGIRLADEILRTKNYEILGFLDDQLKLQGKKIRGHKIFGKISDLSKKALESKPDEIFIAIPSLRGEKLVKIIESIQELGIKAQIMPGIFESIEYQNSDLVPAGELRSIEIGDLLERQNISIDISKISDYLTDKVVLVTGAGGSIGSEIARRISEFGPKKMILFDNYENYLYELQSDLDNPNYRYVVSDIKDKEQLRRVFKKYEPEIVFHAAAHKHVPLMEKEPSEAVKNNILGSNNLIEVAIEREVERFVFISTDKAICPSSIMGATKRFTENQILSLPDTKTTFAIVRFGNVLGSHGSVIPLWQRQLSSGRQITVTSDKMTRFFMTIPEAVQLVVQAGAMAKKNSVFVLKMGKQYRIIDLAQKFLALSGITDIKSKIVITGVRSGEKISETLSENEEKIMKSSHPMIMEINKGKFSELSAQKLKQIIKGFEEKIDFMSRKEIDQELTKAIPTYQPKHNIEKPKVFSYILHFSPPFLGKEEKDAVLEVMDSGWLTTGSKTLEFERQFAEYHQTKFALAVNSATAGLHLALLCLGVGEGDEVIVPSYTFAACANTICWTGAKPVFADISKRGYLVDPVDIEKKITKKTKAIVVVHYGGQMAEIDMILKIAKKHNLKVIEDCAHSPGAKFDGKLAGTFGDLGVFSFYATKNMTSAEGGMVITDNFEYAEKIKILRLHGMSADAFNRYAKAGSWNYEIVTPGYKYNLTDLASSIGLVQFNKLDMMNQKRREIAQQYFNLLADNDKITLPGVLSNRDHVWHFFPILVDPKKRDKIITELKNFNILPSVHFIPLHLMPFYQKKFGCKKGDLPISEWVFEREISLPMHPGLKDKEIEYISQVVKYLV